MFLRMLKHSLNHLLVSRNKRQMKTKPCESNVKTNVKVWRVYPCEWMFVSWSTVLARAAKPVANLPPQICPSPSLPPSVRPSHWTNERVRGERRTGGREGEAVLIPHNHICWRHCMFPLRLIGYSVSQRIFVIQQQNCRYWNSTDTTDADGYFLLEVQPAPIMAPCLDLTPGEQPSHWIVSSYIIVFLKWQATVFMDSHHSETLK